MESITIYPKDEKQKSLLESLLTKSKVKFEIDKNHTPLLSEEDYYRKIEHSIKQAESGHTKTLSKEEQKKLLGL